MANNRMFLCYKPTGRVLCLAKRMGYGWYDSAKQESIEKFLEECEKDSIEEDSHQDAFCLLMEDDEGLVENNKEPWVYNQKETHKLDFVNF